MLLPGHYNNGVRQHLFNSYNLQGSPSRHMQDGPKISRRHTKSDRHMTKYISSKNNATFEKTVTAAELFQTQTE
jgi:hypothetical protein